MSPRGLLSLLVLLSIPLPSRSEDAGLPLTGHLIVLDSGHGVINHNANIINSGQRGHYGLVEHRTAFDIAQRVGNELTKLGANVIYTRSEFDYWRWSLTTAEDNKNRALFANELKADALLSIHCDWSPHSKVSGITTLYETSQSQKLGENIHRKLISESKAKDRKLVHDNFTILDHAEMPALIIETGFLTNRSEARKLSTTDYQVRLARAIASGVKSFFLNQ